MIDIIIVTYNAKHKLKRSFMSLEKHTKNTGYLLTVVNNHSTDGTSLFLKNYQRKNKNVNIINANKNLGFCAGVNLALRNTYNKFIILLDDDAEVTKGWIDGLYAQIKNRPKVGIVGGRIVFPNNRIYSAEYRVISRSLVGFGEIDRGQRNYIKKCDALIGPCWLIRRSLLKKVGYFDTTFFPSQSEDIDYCIRTRLSGFKIIYNGEVKIIHYHLFRDGKQFGKNKQKFMRKWRNLLHEFPLKNSHPVDKYIARGIDYLEKKKFKLSLIEFKKAELIDRRFSEPLYVGRVLIGIGKYDDAIKQFKKILRLNPSNSSAHFYMGIALKEIGDYKRAVQKLKKVISLGTSNFSVHHHLALIYKKLGLVKETKREAKRIFSFISANKRKFLS